MQLGFLEVLKVILLGIVEGVTEWLPISSTGHMLIVDEFIQLNMSEAFKEMFFVVIQLGAILAVVVIFWKKMFPFQFKDETKPKIRKDVMSIWLKVVVACIPGAIVTIRRTLTYTNCYRNRARFLWRRIYPGRDLEQKEEGQDGEAL